MQPRHTVGHHGPFLMAENSTENSRNEFVHCTWDRLLDEETENEMLETTSRFIFKHHVIIYA